MKKGVKLIRYIHASDMTIDKFLLPSGFCSPEHKILTSLEITLRRNSEVLVEKRSVPCRVVVYVFVQRFINSREVEKRWNVEVGGNMSERLSRNVEEWGSTLWKRRRVAVLVMVSILGSLKGRRFRVLVLIGGVSESFCGLIEHKLGGGEEHELRSSTR